MRENHDETFFPKTCSMVIFTLITYYHLKNTTERTLYIRDTQVAQVTI